MWRPYGLSRYGLPCHPQLRYDELFSSWLLRLAWANRLKVHSLCVTLAGNQAAVWNRDIDRQLPIWLQYELEKLTGVPASRIEGAGLEGIASALNGHIPNKNGFETWLLPLGIWHRKRRRFGVQYCPLCFYSESGQYVRRAWRLGFYTECEHHRVLLRDRCHLCGAPFMYFRAELGHRERIDGASMCACFKCGAMLYQAPVERFDWPTVEHSLAVRTLLFMKDFGWSAIQNQVFPQSASLFGVLRQLITIMSSDSAYGQLYDAVAEQIWPDGYRVLSRRGLIYELRGVEERHRLFGMAVWLMMDWPQRFRGALHASGAGCYSMVQGLKIDPPDWYAAEYKFHLMRSMNMRGKAVS